MVFDPDRPMPERALPSVLIGRVLDNADDEGLGRVRLHIPGVIEESAWALPLGVPGGGAKQRGFWFVPDLGAAVAVLFEAGDIDSPWYMPANWGRGEAPTGSAVNVRVIETEKATITIDDGNATVDMRLKAGAERVRLEAGKVIIEAGTIELGAGAAEKVVLGDSFSTLYNAHTHLGVTVGPGVTGIPVVPMGGGHLSSQTKAKI